MVFIKRLQLKHKLLFMMTLLSMFTALSIIGSIAYIEYQNGKEELQKDLELNSHTLSEFLKPQLIAGDKSNISEIFDKAAKYPDVAIIALYDPSYNIICKHTVKDYIDETGQYGKKFLDLLETNNYIEIGRPIYDRSILLGYIRIGVKKVQYYDKLYSYMYQLLILFAIVSILSYNLALLMQSKFTKPIEKLAALLQNNLLEKNGELRALTADAAEHEIAVLYNSYNDLINRINKYILELKDANIKIERTNELKDNIFQNMSHELRTPLNGIIGNSAFLMLSDLEEEDSMMAEMIYKSGKRLLFTIESMLSLSHLDGEDFEMAPSRYNIAEFIQSYYATGIEMLPQKPEVDLTYTIVDENVSANIDPYYFKQALFQIIDNGIKFTKKGYVKIIVDSKQINERKSLVVKVKDTGIGIPEDKLGIIFEPFTQISEGLNRNFEGLGIGLALAKKIIEKHNGVIDIKSEINEGATVSLIIPAS
jgi:signal transduction histidine kinase